jgi:hypothetical protein
MLPLLLAAALVTGHRSLNPQSSLPNPSTLSVTLITFEPGGRVWERFGHNAIWIHDDRTGVDDLYDYGRFSFERPHFLLRFLQGKMWYSTGYESNLRGVLEFYARQGRKIWAQRLNLTQAQADSLRGFLAWNIRPENAEYAYDYYRDNCSTRIRDAFDRVLGGAIRRYAEPGSGWTWRQETLRLNQHNVALYTGLLIALAQPTDREMSRWEQMFLPIRLREHLDSVKVAAPDGSLQPLVSSEQVLAEGGRWPVPDRPSNWALGFLAPGLLLGAALALLGGTRAFMPVATLWALLSGLGGALIGWLWAFSYHLATYRNENVLLLNLFSLALVIVLPSATRGKRWAVRPARALASLVAALAALALVVKLLPGFRQHNLEVIALVLPLQLGLWLGLERRLRALSPS